MLMDIDTLADLLHRAKENDDTAINELYEQIHGVVWFWARAAVKSDDDADEVTQRTLITTFRKLDTIAEPKAFLGWLKTTTLRQAKDYMLAAHNRYDISFHDAGNKDDEGNESDYDPAAEGLEYNPEEALNEKTKKEILTGILDALPADQRLVVNMFWFENMTSKAISEELGCSENTIKSRLKYAKAKIKEKVEEYQKKTGEKLYSVSPIAVLLWLYKDAEKGKVMEIPWGAEAYPALEQTYHIHAPSASNGASGNNGGSGASGSGSADTGASGNVAHVHSASGAAASAKGGAAVSGAAQVAGAAASGAAHAAGAAILSGTVGKALIAAAIVAGVGGSAIGISRMQTGASETSAQSASADSASAESAAAVALPEDGKILSAEYLSALGTPAITVDADDFGDMVSYASPASVGGSTLYPIYEMTGFGSNWGYTNASRYNRQYATDYPTPVIRVQKGGNWGVMDYSGNLLNDYKASVIYYDGIIQSYYEFVDNQYYEMNSDYSQGIHEDLQVGGMFAGVYVRNGVVMQNDLSAETPYVDDTGNRYIAPIFEGEYAWNSTASGYAIVGTDGSVTALPSDGAPLMVMNSTTYYEDMQQDIENGNEAWMKSYSTFANGVIKMKNAAGKIALYDADAQSYITGYDYDDATYYNDGICGVKQGDKWAFIDRSGKLLSDFIYDKVSAVSGGKVVVKDASGIRIMDISAALNSAGYEVPAEESAAPAQAEQAGSKPTVTVLVDKLNIRTAPTTSAESVGHAERGAVYTFSSTVESDGYMWYQISDGNWIADNGEWLAVSN